LGKSGFWWGAGIARDLSIHVPISNESLKVPYGYQNGRFNLIQPVTFQSKQPGYTIGKACRFAVEGRSLYSEPHPEYGDLELAVVGRFLSQPTDTSTDVRRILTEHQVQLDTEDTASLLRGAIDTNEQTLKVGSRLDGRVNTGRLARKVRGDGAYDDPRMTGLHLMKTDEMLPVQGQSRHRSGLLILANLAIDIFAVATDERPGRYQIFRPKSGIASQNLRLVDPLPPHLLQNPDGNPGPYDARLAPTDPRCAFDARKRVAQVLNNPLQQACLLGSRERFQFSFDFVDLGHVRPSNDSP